MKKILTIAIFCLLAMNIASPVFAQRVSLESTLVKETKTNEKLLTTKSSSSFASLGINKLWVSAWPDWIFGTPDDSSTHANPGEVIQYFLNVSINATGPSVAQYPVITDSIPANTCFYAYNFAWNLSTNIPFAQPEVSQTNRATWAQQNLYFGFPIADCTVTDVRVLVPTQWTMNGVATFYVQVDPSLSQPMLISNTATFSADNVPYDEDTHNFNVDCLSSIAWWSAYSVPLGGLYYFPGNGGTTLSSINVVDCITAIQDSEHATTVANSYHYQKACTDSHPWTSPWAATVLACLPTWNPITSMIMTVDVCCW